MVEWLTIDRQWLATMLSFTEVLGDWSCRKIIFYVAYGISAFGLCYIEYNHGWGVYVLSFVRLNILTLAVVLFSIEPVFMLVMLLCTDVSHLESKHNAQVYPYAEIEEYISDEQTQYHQDQEHRYKVNAGIAIIIPCYKSADVIETTLAACVYHVKPEQIFVVDNANSPHPLDNTKDIVTNKFPKVNYIWNPYGNKTLAQYAGVLAAHDSSFILIIDDDVTIPASFHFGLRHFETPNVKAVCYAIEAIHPERKPSSIFIQWQTIEYKLCDFAKMMQHQYSTVLFPHGAASLWDRKILLEILRWHDTVFYADDVKMGIYLQQHGYEMRFEVQSLLPTDAPTSICGAAPNFYCQRVRSWDMAEHVYVLDFIKILYQTSFSTWRGTIVMKFFQSYSVYSIVADWLRLPAVVVGLYAMSWSFFYTLSFIMLLNTAFIFLWNYNVGHCPWVAIGTFQVYKILCIFTRFLGFCRAFWIYLPNLKIKPTIPELEGQWQRKENKAKLTPVWLSSDSRYQDYEIPTKHKKRRFSITANINVGKILPILQERV